MMAMAMAESPPKQYSVLVPMWKRDILREVVTFCTQFCVRVVSYDVTSVWVSPAD